MIRFLISTPYELHKALRERAVKEGQTLTALIRQILRDWVKQQKPTA